MIMFSNKDIAHEEEIVWLEDIHYHDSVRQSLVACAAKRLPIPWGFKVIGYSALRKDAPTHPLLIRTFNRRIFWIKDHDKYEVPDFLQVDPRTVRPGFVGKVCVTNEKF